MIFYRLVHAVKENIHYVTQHVPEISLLKVAVCIWACG